MFWLSQGLSIPVQCGFVCPLADCRHVICLGLNIVEYFTHFYYIACSPLSPLISFFFLFILTLSPVYFTDDSWQQRMWCKKFVKHRINHWLSMCLLFFFNWSLSLSAVSRWLLSAEKAYIVGRASAFIFSQIVGQFRSSSLCSHNLLACWSSRLIYFTQVMCKRENSADVILWNTRSTSWMTLVFTWCHMVTR